MRLTLVVLEGEKVSEAVDNYVNELKRTDPLFRVEYYYSPKSLGRHPNPFPWVQFKKGDEEYYGYGEENVLSLLEEIKNMV